MADSRNPYAPPSAPVSDPIEHLPTDGPDLFIPEGRTVSIGRGVGWITDAWRVFRARPGKWLLNLVFLILIYVVISWLPYGNLLSSLAWPFIGAGIAMAADTQRRQGNFAPDVFFAGLRKPGPLLILGLVVLAMFIVLFAALVVVLGLEFATRYLLNARANSVNGSLPVSSIGLALLLYAIFVLPVTAATYLAPSLIMLHDLKPGVAMKMSFLGSLKNILPAIVFAVTSLVFLLVSLIPIGLGLLISVPVLMISSYTVYRDIFIEPR